jgi:hypothetical protein
MNMEIGLKTAQFFVWNYIKRIFIAVKYRQKRKKIKSTWDLDDGFPQCCLYIDEDTERFLYAQKKIHKKYKKTPSS